MTDESRLTQALVAFKRQMDALDAERLRATPILLSHAPLTTRRESVLIAQPFHSGREEEEEQSPPVPTDDTPTPPVLCCLYPWPQHAYLYPPSGDPDALPPPYPDTDLPDALTVRVNAYHEETGEIEEFFVEVFHVGEYRYHGNDPRLNNDSSHSSSGDIDIYPESPTGSLFSWAILTDFAFHFQEVGGESSTCLVSSGYDTQAGSSDYHGYYFDVTDQFEDTYLVNSEDTITRLGKCQWNGPRTGGGTWMLDYGITTPYKWHLSHGSGGADKTSPQSSPVGTFGADTIA